jgi:transposase
VPATNPNKRKKAPPTQHPLHDEALKMYASGMTCKAVAAELGVYYTTVGRWVQAAGMMRQKGRRPSGTTIREMRHLYQQGYTSNDIAPMVGVSRTTVARYIREAGLTRSRNEAQMNSKPRALTPAQQDEVCRLYVEEGMTAKEIGRQYYCCDATILKTLDMRGIARRRFEDYPREKRAVRPNALSDEQIEQVCWYYEELLMATGDIAKMFHIHPTTVRGYLRANGVPIRRKGGSRRKLPLAERDRVRKMYEEDMMSVGEIGEALGLHYSTVHTRLKSMGIPMRSNSDALRLAYQRGRKQPRGLKPGGRREQPIAA